MTTRGLVTFVVDDAVFSLLSQENSDPIRLGKQVCEIVHALYKENNLKKFKDSVKNKIDFLSKKPLNQEKSIIEIFNQILSEEKISIYDETSFENDWGCDFQYEIDLDDNRFYFRKHSKTIFTLSLTNMLFAEIISSNKDEMGYFKF